MKRASPHARRLYGRFEHLIANCGDYHVSPAKSRIAFLARVRFAAITELGEARMTCGFSMPFRLRSPRFVHVEEVVPGWWTHRLHITALSQLDDQVQSWLRDSYRLMGMQERLTSKARNTAGYSGTPLFKKLGIDRPMTLVTIDAPKEYRAWLGNVPAGVAIVRKLEKPLRAVHGFVTRASELTQLLKTCRKQLEPDGFVWVSWPKKTSNVKTDITEDIIRKHALPLGFVDVKVCAVSDVWSGLRLVVRKSERGARVLKQGPQTENA
jgi:hypothetical protein